MLLPDPLIIGILMGAAIFCLIAHLLQFSSELLFGSYPCHGLRLLEIAGCIWCASVFCILYILMSAGLTFSGDALLVMRWSVLLGALLGLYTAFRSHDWLSMLSGLPFLLTVPFFETAFGGLFPWILVSMLLISALDGLLRAIRSFRSASRLPGPDAVTDAVETLDAGILFTDMKGKVLLKNRIMDGLSLSLCHRKLKNGSEFWEGLRSFQSTEMVTKVSHENSCLFRFAEGYTWSLFRENLELDGKEYFQYLALNVSESEKIRKNTLRKRSEADQLKLRAYEVAVLSEDVETAKHEKENLAQELRGLLEKAERKYAFLKENPNPNSEGIRILEE